MKKNKNEYTNLMKKGFAALTIIISLVIVIVMLSASAYLWFFPYLHDQTLNKFSQSLTNIPLPQETQQIGQISKVGQQIGNGDHCDYFAGQMVKTNLSKDQFENYYRTHYSGKTQIEFLWLGENNNYTTESQFDPTVIHTLKDWISDKTQRDNANVVIYIFEAGMTSALDVRCS